MEKRIEYKEAKDFEKSAFVVSLEQFRDLEKELVKSLNQQSIYLETNLTLSKECDSLVQKNHILKKEIDSTEEELCVSYSKVIDLGSQVDSLLTALNDAYVCNQNMHCFQTKGRLWEQLNEQTLILRKALDQYKDILPHKPKKDILPPRYDDLGYPV